MTFQIVHDGLVREFELFAPEGWQYWLEQVHAIDGRRGLPLVIAMHGGGQDPTVFGLQWPFFTLLDPTCPNYLPAADDKFFVLYPFGSSSSPKGTCAEPGNGSPLRGWNIGFNGDVVPSQDDSSFIISAVDAVQFMLQTELDRLGVALPAVDQHRRYAFGYSMGAMMAHRIAHDVPDYLAALWVMAGAHGGRAHHGLTTTVANTPRGTMSVSLFAHHGDADDVVPPGSLDDHAELVLSDASLRRYEAAGLPTADAEAYAGSVLPLEATVQEFVEHNDLAPTPAEVAIKLPSLDPTDGSVRRTYRGDDQREPANPEVIVYRDPAMGHEGFSIDPDRYVFPATVWDFFKHHPRPLK